MPDPQLSGQTVTMFAPDGSTGEVPAENARAAMQAGGKLAVWMKAPDGSTGMIPQDRVLAAQQRGGQVTEPPAGYSTGNSPKTTWQAFKDLMPAAHDVLHAAGLTREQLIASGQYQAQHPWETVGSALAGKDSPLGMAAGVVKSMVTEGARGAKGFFSNDPREQAVGAIHAASALNPLSAPVTDAMSEQGLGTKEANATGVAGLAPLVAGEAVPRVGPPIIRTAARGANAILEKAPGTIGAGLGAGLAHEVGLPPWMGGAAGYAVGKELLPKLKVPGENFGRPVFGPQPAPPGYVPPATQTIPAGAASTPLPSVSGASATAPAATETIPIGAGSSLPRVRSGEAVLTQALTALDNATLLKVARSRGIDVSAESSLKPGAANGKIITKIIDDFSPDELDEVRNQGMENFANRPIPGPATPESGAEAWRYKVLKTYFPDVPMSQPMQARAQATIAQRPGSVPDYQPTRPTKLPSGGRTLAGRVALNDVVPPSSAPVTAETAPAQPSSGVGPGAAHVTDPQAAVQVKYGKNYDLPKPGNEMQGHWLFPDGTSSGGSSYDASHADMAEHGLGGPAGSPYTRSSQAYLTEQRFMKKTGATRVLLAQDVANVEAYSPLNDAQVVKLANVARQFRWQFHSPEGMRTGIGDFRAFSNAVRQYSEGVPQSTPTPGAPASPAGRHATTYTAAAKNGLPKTATPAEVTSKAAELQSQDENLADILQRSIDQALAARRPQ